MNKTNVQHAINIMKRAGKFNMCTWQDDGDITTEEDLHTCGSAACLGGWIAVSKEFQDDGGSTSYVGSPKIQVDDVTLRGAAAISHWLGIDPSLGNDLCLTCGLSISGMYKEHYIAEITKEVVIEKLEELRDTGGITCE